MTSSFTPPTARGSLNRSKRVRVFLANDGKCWICGLRIKDGEKYEIDHRDALILGGSDSEDNLAPAHVKCHRGKSDADLSAKSKRDRIIDRGYVGPEKRKSSLSSSRYRKTMSGVVVDKVTGEAVGNRRHR